MECININSDLHVKLSFKGFPIPLPDYISNSKGSKISNLDMLTNLPNYCRNITHNYDIEPLKDLLQLVYYSPKGKCKYSTSTLRFALQLRYTSNAAYNLLRQYLPLPSQRLLRCSKSDSIDSIKALSKFREDGFFGNDVVILLDELNLQQQVQFDGQTIIGCNEDLQMFKSILCFMVMSLTNTIPFIIKAIPISKLSSKIVSNGILNCLENLTSEKFHLRAVISDNHRTNISSFNYLMNTYPVPEKKYCMINPYTSLIVYLLLFTSSKTSGIILLLLGYFKFHSCN